VKRFALPLLLLPGVGYLVLFFGLPLAMAVLGSVGIGTVGVRGTGFTLEHYGVLLTDRVHLDALGMSLYLAVAPTVVALALGVPLARALATGFPGRRVFGALYKIPLVVPSIVAAFIVLTLLDRGGIASRVLAPFGLTPPRLVRDPWAIGAVLALSWKAVPFVALIVAGGFASLPADLVPAARTLGAGRRRALWLVELPLVLPSITAAGLLVFVTSTGSFAIPWLLGPVYPAPLSLLMYAGAFEENRWAMVGAMGTTLSVMAALVLVLYWRVTRSATEAAAR